MGQMIVTYADESADHRDPAVYSVCGVLGMAKDWCDLGRRWSHALVKNGLEKTGFHMSWCEAGVKLPYDAMDRTERDALYRIFIVSCTYSVRFASTLRSNTDFPKLKALSVRDRILISVVIKPRY